ncbi:MAG: excinuclease ABC subunit UvrC [Rickettsiales bacterium]
MQNSAIKNFLKNCPNAPGVYKFYNDVDEIIYIGKAKKLKNRIKSYIVIEESSYKLSAISHLVARVEIIVTDNESESFLLESNLIKKFKPKYNILLKDDKSFPYIILDKSTFPRMSKFRGNKKSGFFLYGPFPSSYKVDNTIKLLQKVFLLRSCSDSYFSSRKRPCLLYQIKRCSAPCVNKVSSSEYHDSVEQAKDFLSGNVQKIRQRITSKMNECSKRFEYEKAGELRDKLKALNFVEMKQFIIETKISDVDIITAYRYKEFATINITFIRCGHNLGDRNYNIKNLYALKEEHLVEKFIGSFYQKNIPAKKICVNALPDNIDVIEKALSNLHDTKVSISCPIKGSYKLQVRKSLANAKVFLEQAISANKHYVSILRKLRDIFSVSFSSNKIEVYDNSHIMGKNCVGARIVWYDGEFQKKYYRRYNLDNFIETGGDDYQMLYQVLKRRLKGRKELDNFFIFDGGKGHLMIVNKILSELKINIDFICISKGRDRNSGNETIYGKDGNIYELNKKDEVKQFLQRLRDEAHRYALSTHQKKRQNNMFITKLDMIPGIGSKRKNSLLSHFGSLKRIGEASPEELTKVNLISQKFAKKIYDSLNNSN